MHKIFIIARREYLERVRTKSFIVMTLLIPALILGVTVAPSLLSSRGLSGAKHLVVVTSDVRTGDLFRQALNKLPEKQRKQTDNSREMQQREMAPFSSLIVDVTADASDAKRVALIEDVRQKHLDGVIFATRDALTRKKIIFMTPDVSSFAASAEIETSINEALRRDLLESKGLTDAEIENALEPLELDTQSPTGMGNPRAVFFTVFSMVMILYVAVMLYGVNVIRAIVDEKSSRIMEVMLAAARPTEMMAGKIIGVGAVGLTQIAIWTLMAFVPTALGLIAAAGMLKGILSAKLLLYFAGFFLLGYSLYSTLCAAVGAIVNSEQEAQQMQFLVMMPLILSVIIMVNVIQNPASPISVLASLFPLTAPLVMFLRIALQSPPVWQVALSIALMIATVFGLVWVCARIYRVGILMYGKKPTLPEIMKWIRYA